MEDNRGLILTVIGLPASFMFDIIMRVSNSINSKKIERYVLYLLEYKPHSWKQPHSLKTSIKLLQNYQIFIKTVSLLPGNDFDIKDDA